MEASSVAPLMLGASDLRRAWQTVLVSAMCRLIENPYIDYLPQPGSKNQIDNRVYITKYFARRKH
jgi:hypothetical protein